MPAPFIGRTRELDAIRAALPGPAAGRGRFVAISGDAGIGKTRLMAEIAALAESRGVNVLWSQMIEDPVAPPFFAWMLLLRAALQNYTDEELLEDVGSGAVDLADIVPELRDRLRLQQNRPLSGSTAARYQLFDAVTRFLLAAARRRPLVLLFDNLHLADRSSVEMLEYYCQQITASCVLVVVACRDIEMRHNAALRSALTRLSRNSGYQRFELGGLLRDEVAALLQVQTGKPPPTPLVDAVVKQSDGNPLFVAEVGDVLARRSRSGRLPGTGANFEIPESLRDVISARLDLLPQDVCRALGLAAVLGRDFDADVLFALAGSTREGILQKLDLAETAGIIETLKPGAFRFHHALYREVLYTSHGKLQRAGLHRRAAEHLEQRFVDDPVPQLPQLAYHYFESAHAGCYRKAVDYCRRAGDAAVARRAFNEAAALYEQAMQAAELSPAPDCELQFELLSALGQAQYRAGEVIAASETLLKPALLAYRSHWWRRLAEAVIAFQAVRGQTSIGHVAAVPLHETAIEHLVPDDLPQQARLLASLAVARRLADDPETAKSTLRDSVALARQCNDDEVLMSCLGKVLWAALAVDARERAAMLSEALDIARRSGRPDAVLEAMKSLPFPLSDLGEIDEIQRLLPEIRSLACAERHLHFLNIVAGFETAVAILQGQWFAAIRHAADALRQAPLMGVVGLEGRFGFQMFAIQKARGALGDVAELADRITGSSDSSQLWLPGQILLHCELGQMHRAKTAMARLGDFDKLPADDLRFISLVYLSEACAHLRDVTRCRRLYALLTPFRGLNVSVASVLMLGAVSGYLAPLAVILRRPKEARLLFDEAIEMNTRMGALPALARNCVDYADMLLQADREADRVHGRQLLGQAAPIARALELQPVLAVIERLETDIARGHLTVREIDVLRLIAAGASNKKISSELHISHSTVATHVRNILGKIGASNRTEAAEYARRTNMLPAG
jgi:DNA-binding CsgD family transcriptional regulator